MKYWGLPFSYSSALTPIPSKRSVKAKDNYLRERVNRPTDQRWLQVAVTQRTTFLWISLRCTYLGQLMTCSSGLGHIDFSSLDWVARSEHFRLRVASFRFSGYRWRFGLRRCRLHCCMYILICFCFISDVFCFNCCCYARLWDILRISLLNRIL